MPDSSSAAHSMHWADERTDAPRPGPTIEQELEALYNAHADALLRYSVSATANLEFARESVQEVFLRYAEFRQCDPPPPTALVWLLRELRSYIGRRSRDNERQIPENLTQRQQADPAPSPEALALVDEAKRIIDKLAAPRELECFLLRSEGLSYQEIANMMGISVGTVGATLARAVRKLEQAMQPGKDAPR